MTRRHVVLALVVAVCWAVNFGVIDIGLESFPPLLFAALRFGLIAFPAIFFVAPPDVRWPAAATPSSVPDAHLRKRHAANAGSGW